jgi:mitotic spindle assembly checkpoint protein MAD2
MAPNMEGSGGGGVATQNNITLRGSTKIVTEFFNYAVNSILYQRGIYAPENFERTKKYGLSMMVTTDEGLVKYLGTVLTQISEWLTKGKLEKLVLVVASVHTSEVLERWQFDIEQSKMLLTGRSQRRKRRRKSCQKSKPSFVKSPRASRSCLFSVTLAPLT